MSEPFLGEITIFGGNFAPVGWMFCAGQILPISQYDALFSLLGTTYGGDGQTTFALPNLQSRVPLHMGNGFTIGQTGGAESVTLNPNQLPIHTHTANANSTGGLDSPGGNVWATASGTIPYAADPPNATMNPANIKQSGGNLPHDNMIPTLTLNYIIAVEGVYPSQS